MRHNKFIILAAVALILSGCTLDSVRYGSINQTMFPQSVDDCEALVVGNAYTPFRSKSYDGLFCCNHDGIHVLGDMTTDVGYCVWSDSYWPELLTFNFDPTTTHGVVKLYRNNINGITKMTQTMKRIEAVEMEESVKNRMKAEIYCARGWLSYILYSFFGGLQIADDEFLDNPTESSIVLRKSEEETAKFVEDNLLAALELNALPVVLKKGDINYGRFTQALVHMVLMKFYMYEGRWEDAVTHGRELMKPEYGFDLMPEYADIFTIENEGNKETIWACECTTGICEQLWITHAMPSDYPHSNDKITIWGGGYKCPWSFYNTFDPKDKRLEVLVGEYTSTDGSTYNQANPGRRLQYGALPIKYGIDPDAIGEGSSIDWIVFRYADLLTLLAEAIVRDADAVTSEAVELLNRVRTRSLLGKGYSAGDFADVQAFYDAVLQERGHELWFEGVRREDLIRHGKYIEYARKYKNSVTAEDHMVLFPLPQDVINEGRGKVHQNPGY